MAEVLRMHRHCMLSTFYKRPIRLKKAYYPGSTILWNRVSPLHVNLQVANFQKYERAFTCPITLSQFTCMGYTVTHMHPLQVDVLLCTLYCTVLYTAQQYSIFTSSPGYLGVSIKAACNWYCEKCQAIMMETKVKIFERVE